MGPIFNYYLSAIFAFRAIALKRVNPYIIQKSLFLTLSGVEKGNTIVYDIGNNSFF